MQLTFNKFIYLLLYVVESSSCKRWTKKDGWMLDDSASGEVLKLTKVVKSSAKLSDKGIFKNIISRIEY